MQNGFCLLRKLRRLLNSFQIWNIPQLYPSKITVVHCVFMNHIKGVIDRFYNKINIALLHVWNGIIGVIYFHVLSMFNERLLTLEEPSGQYVSFWNRTGHFSFYNQSIENVLILNMLYKLSKYCAYFKLLLVYLTSYKTVVLKALFEKICPICYI